MSPVLFPYYFLLIFHKFFPYHFLFELHYVNENGGPKSCISLLSWHPLVIIHHKLEWFSSKLYNNMNANKKLLHIYIEFLSWLSFLLASIFLGYFVKDIWNDFKSGKTNDRIYSETRQYFEHPTITVCFEPEIDITKLEEYNVTSINDLYLGIDENINQDIPVIPLVEKGRYKIGRDFTLTWKYYDSNGTSEVHTIQNTDHLQGKLKYVIVKELPLFNYGKCTVIQLNDTIQTPIGMYNTLTIILKSEAKEILPNLKVYFTSKDNFVGAATLQWMEGERIALEIDPYQLKSPYVNLRLGVRKQLREASNCSTEIGYNKCVSNG